jgi:hypothetical protein
VKWIQRHPKIEAFKTSDKSEVLILECFEFKEAKWSPMTRFAQLYMEDVVTRENALPIFLWAHGIRAYIPREAITLMMAKILNEGFDPNLAIPSNASRPIQMLAALVTSHRRVSPISIVIDSIGLFDDHPEYAKGFAKDWQALCQRFIDMTKSNAPDLKPVKLLLVNPVESKAATRSRGSILAFWC